MPNTKQKVKVLDDISIDKFIMLCLYYTSFKKTLLFLFKELFCLIGSGIPTESWKRLNMKHIRFFPPETWLLLKSHISLV